MPQVLNCWKSHCPSFVPKPCWLQNRRLSTTGLDIYGFFLSEIGLGHSARLYYAAAAAAQLNVHAINRELPGRQMEQTFTHVITSHGESKYSLSIDGLVGFGGLSREICRLRHNIALPLWELETYPQRRLRNLRRFDAIWAPSTFIKAHLETASDRRVELVPHPLRIPEQQDLKKCCGEHLKILFFFDFDSFPARKNPEAAVKAFQAAFPRKEDVLLTIKTRGTADAGRRSWLTEQASRDSRITIIDKTLSSDRTAQMMRDHDVFLSLHRSEGFGLGCAEALAIGNIVVATDYGGTRDFITETSGFPVDWTRVDVQKDEYTDATGATWANPSIEHAAHRLQQVYNDPAQALEKARLGHEHLKKTHSLDAVGQRIAHILKSY